MDEQLRQEISGRFYAHELLINVLLAEHFRRLPDGGKDTEYLEALVTDMQKSFAAQAPGMSPVARQTAERTILSLIGASLSPYWR